MLDIMLTKGKIVRVTLKQALQFENYSVAEVRGSVAAGEDFLVVNDRWIIPWDNVAGIVVLADDEIAKELPREDEKVKDIVRERETVVEPLPEK